MENKVKLSPPWVTYANEIKALFGDDPQVRIEFRDKEESDPYTLKIYVDGNLSKYEAIDALLPDSIVFGNVTLNIAVIPPNTSNSSTADLIEAAFEGNPALSFIRRISSPFGKFDYVVFKNKVVQFYNDEMGDINGNRSTLYQDVAKDVFGSLDGVYFCTDTPDTSYGVKPKDKEFDAEDSRTL